MTKPLKILSVFGTRPEAVKMAPVVQELARHPGRLTSRVCVTGQHRQMLDQVLQLFDVRPDYDLDIMQHGQTLTGSTALVLQRLEPIILDEKPDWILVQGDTTTVAAAALAGYYHRCKVGHVEAGLRSYDKWQPFPEEINRKVAGVTADVHFAPTTRSRDNLLREGVSPGQVVVTGNPVIDALHWVVQQPYNLADLDLPVDDDARLILVTAHRRENFGRPLEQICLALRDLAEHYQGQAQIVYPVHLNPNVQEPVKRLLGDVPNIHLLPPLDYLPLVHVMRRAEIVLTDSGGIQEEAPGLGKPVLVLRETTERPEAVDAGTVRLVGSDRNSIVREASRLLDDPAAYRQMAQSVNPYGDGRTSQRIAAYFLGEPFEEFV